MIISVNKSSIVRNRYRRCPEPEEEDEERDPEELDELLLPEELEPPEYPEREGAELDRPLDGFEYVERLGDEGLLTAGLLLDEGLL